jgi:protein kinase-like protein
MTRGQAKVLDFGLAKVALRSGNVATSAPPVDVEEHLTSPGSTLGTVAYMSPEQVRARELDARADLFSFGVVLYVTGTLPFRGESTGVIFREILDQAPVPAVRLNPDVPADLERIISKCLEKDRNLRYQSAAEVRSDLMRLRRDTDTAKGGAVVASPGPVAVAQELRAQPVPASDVVKTPEIQAAGRKRLWRVLARTAMPLMAIAAIVGWLSRPAPPPRLLKTLQITRDGLSKINVLSDGSRLYINESTGTTWSLVQTSVKGGDTAVIPTSFSNVFMSDLSPDHSQLLVINMPFLGLEGQAWLLPLPAGAPHPLPIQTHWAVWSPEGGQIAFAKGSEILLANSDGTNSHKLTTVNGSASSIRFSILVCGHWLSAAVGDVRGDRFRHSLCGCNSGLGAICDRPRLHWRILEGSFAWAFGRADRGLCGQHSSPFGSGCAGKRAPGAARVCHVRGNLCIRPLGTALWSSRAFLNRSSGGRASQAGPVYRNDFA